MTVKYIGATQDQIDWYANDDPRSLLTVGQVYEVWRRTVHSVYTEIILKDYKHLRFNSVCFELVEGFDTVTPSLGDSPFSGRSIDDEYDNSEHFHSWEEYT